MNRIFLSSLGVVIMSGCAGIPQPPVNVMLIPDDCANQAAITRWLDDIARHPRSPLQTQRDYDNNITNIKARMWSLRYRCDPVR